jgi:hypothetical protein
MAFHGQSLTLGKLLKYVKQRGACCVWKDVNSYDTKVFAVGADRAEHEMAQNAIITYIIVATVAMRVQEPQKGFSIE